MEIDNNIFAKEKIHKLLLKFAIPSIISLLIIELYNMVDTVFVGRYIGPKAIAALTIAFPIQRTITAIGMLIALGASTYTARTLGEKNISDLKKIITNSFSLTLLLLVPICILIFIFKQPLLFALGASQSTYPLAKEYIAIILLGGVFQCLSVVACYIMVSLGNTKITLYTSLIGVTLNIVINYVLLAWLKLGISGAAIATVISQISAFAFALYKFKAINKTFNIHLKLKLTSHCFDKNILNKIITIGFSTFVIEIADAIVAIVLNNILYAEGGDSAIVMVGVITKISMFMFIAIIGISSAMQPIVAYNFGAENYDKMQEALSISIKTVIITAFSFWSVLMLFSKPIIGFFLKDADLLSQTVKAFRICISLLPLAGVYYIGMYYYQAIGKAKTSFLLSIYRETILFIPLSILMVQIFGMKGAWITYPITDAIAALTSIYFIKKAEKETLSYDLSSSLAGSNV